ncbi:hypothetical protein AB9K26_07695 [Psychroserpens sp. XS_ASV72]|uniref:hypothetical protein n=1 Tax=Psychroserpens sp. XS_ASV72 TaxID=3241293 RepID=UPI003515AD4A
MRKNIKIIGTILIFLAVGELLIRLNKTYDILSDAPEIISIEMENSELKNALDQNAFNVNENQLRILVLGDSYINGGGVNPKDKFSRVLEKHLNTSDSVKKDILVLDVSRPSNNTFDNYQTFKFYQNRFQPQVVFWAYNFNDVLGSFKSKDSIDTLRTGKKQPKRQKKQFRNNSKAFVNNIYSKSELLRFISVNTQKELKLKGWVMPFGDFYYLTNEAYVDDGPKWKQTQDLLKDVAKTCKADSTTFILYKIPEFNLLGQAKLFSMVNSKLSSFCESSNILFINGDDDFSDPENGLFRLSRYDGHPNALAHKKMAVKMKDYILEQLQRTD